jgi:hypothetical protein
MVVEVTLEGRPEQKENAGSASEEKAYHHCHVQNNSVSEKERRGPIVFEGG